MRLNGWILDLYPGQQGMTIWLIDANQAHYRLSDSFAPAFYVSGAAEKLSHLQRSLEQQRAPVICQSTERIDLWQNRLRQVLKISVQSPVEFVRWGRWVHRFDSRLQLYNSDLMVASLYCWQTNVFPLARVEVEADENGNVQRMERRDDEWALDYELPPLKIMQIRLVGFSRIDPNHGRRAALEIESEGRCFELDENDEPPALGFARLLKREDPDVILSEWGDATILPLLRERASRLKLSLQLNRDSSVPVQQSKPHSFMSYGRILFKNSATTLFGRLHVDKQNSFISEKCDFAGLWELARITKLPSNMRREQPRERESPICRWSLPITMAC